MDKRVKTVKPNYYIIDPTDFLKDSRSNIEKYRYVLDHHVMLGLKPNIPDGEDGTHFLVLFTCEGVYCEHSFYGDKDGHIKLIR